MGSKALSKVHAALETLRDLEYDLLVGCGDDALGCPYVRHSAAEKLDFFKALLATGRAG